MSATKLIFVTRISTFQKSSGWSLYHLCINSSEGFFLIPVFEVPYIFQVWYSKLQNLFLACCYFGDPPEDMVVRREQKFIFLCTSTCLQSCRTGYNFMCNLFSKIWILTPLMWNCPVIQMRKANGKKSATYTCSYDMQLTLWQLPHWRHLILCTVFLSSSWSSLSLWHNLQL